MMTPISSPQMPTPSAVVTPVNTEVNQSTITASFDGLLAAMRQTPDDVPNLRRLLITVFDEINAAKDADHVSDLFGSGATKKDDNICLLYTLIDGGNILADVKAQLHTLLKAKCAESGGSEAFSFDKILKMQEQVLTEGSKTVINKFAQAVPAQPGPGPLKKVQVGDNEFVVERTIAGSRDGIHGDNNCLAYSLQTNNAPLAENYRVVVFSQPNIEAQLNRMLAQTESGGAARHGDAPAFQAVYGSVRANYPDMPGLQADTTISALSAALAQHIQTSGCMLDSDIAAGILAARSKRPLVVVSGVGEEHSYSVFDRAGVPIYQGAELEGVPTDLLSTAKFIRNENGLHFERMTRVATPVTRAV